MKVESKNISQFDSYQDIATFCRKPSKKKKRLEFDFILEHEIEKEGEDYKILLPRHGRFWDNGYEDIE